MGIGLSNCAISLRYHQYRFQSRAVSPPLTRCGLRHRRSCLRGCRGSRPPGRRGAGCQLLHDEYVQRHGHVNRNTLAATSGSLLRRPKTEVQVLVFVTGYEADSVLPTRGNTELFQPQGFRQGLLWQRLFGEYRGDAIRSLVALWWIEENKFLDLTQLLHELFLRVAGPCRLGLAVLVLLLRHSQHAI